MNLDFNNLIEEKIKHSSTELWKNHDFLIELYGLKGTHLEFFHSKDFYHHRKVISFTKDEIEKYQNNYGIHLKLNQYFRQNNFPRFAVPLSPDNSNIIIYSEYDITWI